MFLISTTIKSFKDDLDSSLDLILFLCTRFFFCIKIIKVSVSNSKNNKKKEANSSFVFFLCGGGDIMCKSSTDVADGSWTVDKIRIIIYISKPLVSVI